MSRVALCVDELACQHPELIGLEGESLDAQAWLGVFSSGAEARKGVRESDAFSEVWVVSCDDVEPINLAASIKSDKPNLRVRLVASEMCGSLLSRAHTAHIDEVVDQSAFPRRYADLKLEWGDVAKASARASKAPMQSLSSAAVAMEAPAQDATSAPLGERQSGRVVEAEEQAPSWPAFATEPIASELETASLACAQTALARGVAQTANRAFVLPIVSGSGGAGKSAVSALGALIAHRMGHHTLLLDYDLQFGDVASMVGVEEPLRLDVALAHPDQLEREVAREDRMAVLAPPARLEAAESVVRGLPDLMERLSGSFDVIIANTGAAWAEQHAALLERSSAALFLIDQRASSVRACKHALELCARCGIATGPFQYALNRCAKGAPLTSIDVSCALQGAAVFELKEGGRDVEDYLSSASASELLDMKNEFAKSLEYVMRRLLPGGAHAGAQLEAQPDRRMLLRRGRHVGRKHGRR